MSENRSNIVKEIFQKGAPVVLSASRLSPRTAEAPQENVNLRAFVFRPQHGANGHLGIAYLTATIIACYVDAVLRLVLTGTVDLVTTTA